jgi:hypothetical protein
MGLVDAGWIDTAYSMDYMGQKGRKARLADFGRDATFGAAGGWGLGLDRNSEARFFARKTDPEFSL